MNTDEAREIIFRALGEVAPEIDPTEVAHGVDLTEQLDLDSMDYLNWMLEINLATGIEIPERDYSQFITIDAAASYLVNPGG
jgi:acyl carrier protein